MSPSIFISYRRADSETAAGRLFDHLSAHFGASHVFMDVDTIGPGENFMTAIERAVGACDALIAVIGPRWLDLTDAQGNRRLDKPDDIVAAEIATALERDILVIPVLVQGARMPGAQDLRKDLETLALRNALEISHSRWQYDTSRLIQAIEREVGPAEVVAAETRSASEGSGLDALKQVVTDIGHLPIWAMVVAAAIPLVLHYLFKIGPPWPDGIAFITTLVEAVVFLAVFQFLYGLALPKVHRLIGAFLALMLVGAIAYGFLLSWRTFRHPVTQALAVKGFVLTEGARTVADELHVSEDELLEYFEFEPTQIWTELSLTSARMSLAGSWLTAFVALAGFVGSFLIHRRRASDR